VNDYLSRAEVARLLGVSIRTLRRLHVAGALRAIPVTPAGRKLVYRRADLEAYLKAREAA
jgi:excisionase family DNA binding protein